MAVQQSRETIDWTVLARIIRLHAINCVADKDTGPTVQWKNWMGLGEVFTIQAIELLAACRRRQSSTPHDARTECLVSPTNHNQILNMYLKNHVSVVKNWQWII